MQKYLDKKGPAAEPEASMQGPFMALEVLAHYGINLSNGGIHLTGEVNQSMYNQVVLGLACFGPKETLDVSICSHGGSYIYGTAIYDLLAAHKGKVVVTALGEACSAASLILQAGDVRQATPSTIIMVHDVSSILAGKTSEKKSGVDFEAKLNEQMYTIYAKRSKKPASFWRKTCKQDSFLLATQAKRLGLIDKITK